MIRETLEKLFSGEILSSKEAKQTMLEVATGGANASLSSLLLGAYRHRAITSDELFGYREGLFQLAKKPIIEFENLVEVCGTGGDNKKTINISTLNAFVLAGAGYKVAKHGNFKYSSQCGSSDILSELGIKFLEKESLMNESLENANFVYLHAPLFHPSLKVLAPIRKELGFRTFINLLGPISNPIKPSFQLTGVYDTSVLDLYSEVLKKDSSLTYGLVHSVSGYDEVSLTSDFIFCTRDEQKRIKESDFEKLFGTKPLPESALFGENTLLENAKKFIKILKGEGGIETKTVAANAAMAISLKENISIDVAFQQAEEAIFSQKAYKMMMKAIEISQK